MDPNATLQVTGAVAWRREGIKYKKNEVRGLCEVWVCVRVGVGAATCRAGMAVLRCLLRGLPTAWQLFMSRQCAG